jgi:hypothetical protein
MHTQVTGHAPGLYMNLLDNTKNKKIANAIYNKNGCEIRKLENGTFLFEDWTFENNTHILSARAVLDADGRIADEDASKINCYEYGFMELEQDWIDFYLNDLADQIRAGQRKWDIIQ